MIRVFSLAALCLIFGAAAAQAGPVAAAFTAIQGVLAAGGFGAFAIRLVAGLALNAIGNALQKRAARRAAANQRDPGIRTSVTLTGGVNPDGMIAGDYATGGSLVAPPLEHGANNIYNSAVIDLSGVPLTGLNRVFVNGAPIDLGATDQTVEGLNFGKPALGRFADHLWVKFYDGSQTAADPMLLARGQATPPDVAWTQRDSGTTQRLRNAFRHDGLWVVVGDAGTILTSQDGIVWTARTSGTTRDLFGLTYANGLWVACGTNGTILTSASAITWTARSSGTSNLLQDITHDGAQFVVVGSGGTIRTSPDGVTWTARTSGTTKNLAGVGFNGSLLVAVGEIQTILLSTDGITWTEPASDFIHNSYFLSVIYAQGRWVAAGAGSSATSTDNGQTWQPVDTKGAGTNVTIAFGNGRWFQSGQNAGLSTSIDGVAWTQINRSVSNDTLGLGTFGTASFLDCVAYGSGQWLLIGEAGTLLTGAEFGGQAPAYPWSSDMVGIGRAYAICSYKFNREVWQGPPSFRFETASARFYDMRKDTTQGGDGAHRLNDPVTWEATSNPIVMVAHLALGYTLPDGTTYGGGYSQTQLPLADWAAAMNACDALLAGLDGSNEAAWRAGLEISFEDEPLDAINALLQACDGDIVDRGGVLYPKVGAPGLPVAFITDADLIVSQPETLEPFPGLQQTVNGVALSHPLPAVAWETVEAPRVLRPDLEAEDGDRRLIQSLTIPACPYSGQIQRLGQALVRDARRWRRHILTLPRDLAWVRPLQTIAWTSDRNGYSAKVFEVAEQAIDLWSYDAQVTLREVDPADYTPQAYEPVNTAIAVAPSSAPIALANAGAEAITLNDANGDPRRPAIRAFWDGFSGAGVEVEISRDGVIVSQTTAPSSASAAIVSGEIIANEVYSVRLRPVASGTPVAWSGPFVVTAPNVLLGGADLTENSVATANIVAGSVTLSGVVDAGAVTNDATTWDTVASLTLSDLPASAFLSGALEFRLTAGEADATNYPVDAEWRVTVAGVARRTIDRDLMLDRGGAYFTGYFTAEAVGPGDVVVVFEIRNMGGLGVESATLFAQAAMR
jgi:hypothetical protein